MSAQHTPTLEINPGERYAGLVLDAATRAPSHHLVLLPGEAEEMIWEDASKWAKEQGGDLPTRQEQALLFANLKSEFKPNWYWSGEKASANSAWYQGFGNGYQGGNYLNVELRVRAVRRLSATPPAQTLRRDPLAPPAHTPTLEINPGERYAGLVLDAVTGLPSHHLVLLPGEAAGMNWEDASKWAKEQGGDLPTRQEQSLLFANLKSEFQPEWYWSGEKASEVSAWYQVFRYGFAHNDTYLTCEVRVRAVRRLSAAPPAQTPSWVDVAAKTKIARAVYERLRSHIQGLGPWSALDADTVQALADAVTLPPAQTPRREPLALPGINKAEGGAA